ncbi:MAG: hypothetical protein AAGJ68_09505 [Pseudomonadota bacterium]
MSSLPPLSLPRFHVNKLTHTHKDPKAAQTHLTQEEPFEVAETVEEEAAPEMADQAQAQPDLPAQPILPEIDTGIILERLEAAMSGLERSALAHSQQLVSDFIRAAFPNLSEAFLADEVLTATEAMAPNEVERLTLTVPAAFESAFQRSIQASSRMTEVCELKVHDANEDILVDVDWCSGGLAFDMTAFLESSLGRLTGPTHMQEGQDV